MSENGPGSTIEGRRVRQLERELQLLRSVRRQPGKPAYTTHRYALCKACGTLEVYAVGRTLFKGDGPKKGRARRDPGRLENQRCKACGRTLGRYAHARARDRFKYLHERREEVARGRQARALERAAARHTDRLAVAFGSSGPSSRRTSETPVTQTSAGALARGASSAPLITPERV